MYVYEVGMNSTMNALQLEAEGQGLRPFPCPWNPSSNEANSFQLQMHASNPMEMEPEPNFLQIGYVNIFFLTNIFEKRIN